MADTQTFPDKAALAGHVADLWLERIGRRHGVFTVALSGGRIPRLLYEAVVARAAGVSFKGVHFFWGDERCVPPGDAESNYRLAAEGLLEPLRIPEEQAHRIPVERGEAFAVAQAEAEICRVAEVDDDGQPVLDLAFLGMGEDGHVASLFPGDVEALETHAVYSAVTGPKPPPRRITLGYPALANAREVWVLASGEGKAGALGESLAEDGDTPLARVLKSRTHTGIFTDFELP